RLVILSGPHGEGIVPADFYRRLASDLRTAEVPVVVDLAGERLDAVLEGGVAAVKVSDEELRRDGRVAEGASVPQLVAAMRELRAAGAEVVAVTRAERPTLLQLADRKSTRLNSSHVKISYAVFCLKKKSILNKYRE